MQPAFYVEDEEHRPEIQEKKRKTLVEKFSGKSFYKIEESSS